MDSFVPIPVSIIITVVSTLALAIVSLTTIFWQFVQARFKAQDEIIDKQDAIINQLQFEITRMGKGCGAANCVWKS